MKENSPILRAKALRAVSIYVLFHIIDVIAFPHILAINCSIFPSRYFCSDQFNSWSWSRGFVWYSCSICCRRTVLWHCNIRSWGFSWTCWQAYCLPSWSWTEGGQNYAGAFSGCWWTLFIFSSVIACLQYFEKVAERIKDTGVSVRKRAIKIIRDLCTSNSNFSEATSAFIEIISRVTDEESSIQVSLISS